MEKKERRDLKCKSMRLIITFNNVYILGSIGLAYLHFLQSNPINYHSFILLFVNVSCLLTCFVGPDQPAMLFDFLFFFSTTLLGPSEKKTFLLCQPARPIGKLISLLQVRQGPFENSPLICRKRASVQAGAREDLYYRLR